MWKNGLFRSFSSFFEKEYTLGTYIHGTNCSPHLHTLLHGVP